MHKRFILGSALLLSVSFAGTTVAATTNVIVTPSNDHGWIIPLPDNPPVAYGYNGPSDSAGGNGSLDVGPITAPSQSKLELQPPEVGEKVAAFGGLSYEFRVLAPAAVGTSANQFYTNVYVDSAANGLGFFGSGGSSSGFYDCRYSFVAASGGAGWTAFSFNGGTAHDGLNARHPSCQATLGGFTDASVIEFFRINVGDTSANDNGLEGALDLVSITFGAGTTVYDFEPYLVATTKADCKDGGWTSIKRDDGSPFVNQGDCVQYVSTGK